MNENLLGILLGALGLSLILVTLSAWLLRGSTTANDTYSGCARFFLVALRVVIGWHCFVEGMEKLSTPTWSSEAYLREAIGPLALPYRAVAGDRLIDQLQVTGDGTPSATLVAQIAALQTLAPAGSPLGNVAQLALASKDVASAPTFPAELERDWRDYLHMFASQYRLTRINANSPSRFLRNAKPRRFRCS